MKVAHTGEVRCKEGEVERGDGGKGGASHGRLDLLHITSRPTRLDNMNHNNDFNFEYNILVRESFLMSSTYLSMMFDHPFDP